MNEIFLIALAANGRTKRDARERPALKQALIDAGYDVVDETPYWELNRMAKEVFQKQSEPTPGPWLYSHEHAWNRSGGLFVAKSGAYVIHAKSWDQSKIYDDEKNARILAAAPDMLKALKVIAVWANNPNNNSEDYADIHALSMEAITKAEGEGNI